MVFIRFDICSLVRKISFFNRQRSGPKGQLVPIMVINFYTSLTLVLWPESAIVHCGLAAIPFIKSKRVFMAERCCSGFLAEGCHSSLQHQRQHLTVTIPRYGVEDRSNDYLWLVARLNTENLILAEGCQSSLWQFCKSYNGKIIY